MNDRKEIVVSVEDGKVMAVDMDEGITRSELSKVIEKLIELRKNTSRYVRHLGQPGEQIEYVPLERELKWLSSNRIYVLHSIEPNQFFRLCELSVEDAERELSYLAVLQKGTYSVMSQSRYKEEKQ